MSVTGLVALKNKLNNKHFLALAGNIVMSGIGILTFGLILRNLSIADAGIWMMFLTATGLAEMLRTGLLQTTTIKFYTGADTVKANNVLGSVWYLALIITALFLLLNLLVFIIVHFLNINHEVVTLQWTVIINWFGVTLLSSLPYSLAFWVLIADERYDKILWIRLLNSGSMIIYMIVLIVLKKMTIDSLMWCNFLTNCLAAVFTIATGASRLKTLLYKTRECTIQLFHYGKFGMGTTVVSNLFSNADKIIIISMLGPAGPVALATYGVPLKLMELVEMPLRSFVGTGMTGMAFALNKDKLDEATYTFKKFVGMLTWLFLPMFIFAFFFADIAVDLLGGGKYTGTEAANIFRFFMLLSLFYPFDRFCGVTLDLINKPNINFYKVIGTLIITVIGDVLGLLIFKSIYGVALCSAFSLAFGILFGNYHLRKHMNYKFKELIIIGFAEMKWFIKRAIKR